MITFAVFLTLIAFVPTVLAWQEWRDWFYLWRFGIVIPAQVQHHWTGKLGLFLHYYVIYEFEGETPDGEYFFHSRFTEVERDAYELFLEGDPLMVRYASVRPAIFRLVGQSTSHIRYTLASIIMWVWTLLILYATLF